MKRKRILLESGIHLRLIFIYVWWVRGLGSLPGPSTKSRRNRGVSSSLLRRGQGTLHKVSNSLLPCGLYPSGNASGMKALKEVEQEPRTGLEDAVQSGADADPAYSLLFVNHFIVACVLLASWWGWLVFSTRCSLANRLALDTTFFHYHNGAPMRLYVYWYFSGLWGVGRTYLTYFHSLERFRKPFFCLFYQYNNRGRKRARA